MFMICVRRIRNGVFDDEPEVGPTRYLDVPSGAAPHPSHEITRGLWIKRILATFNKRPDGSGLFGDLTMLVHGYNNNVADVGTRHLQVRDGLAEQEFSTTVISFDWPSGKLTLGYLEDRYDAYVTAFRLVRDGIRVLLAVRRPDCDVNVHILAHSMGAYVVREAFKQADDSTAAAQNWTANQVVFVGADISSGSLAATRDASDGLYRHSYRLTNYFSGRDEALQISNAKRLGLSPRAGRVGLPVGAPDLAVDVNCTARYEALAAAGKLSKVTGTVSHSWYFWDRGWYADLAATLLGRVDRSAISTRSTIAGSPTAFRLDPVVA